MAHVLYQCPRTGMKVQAWMADDPGSQSQKSFELMHCPACAQMHFVDRRSGKLLGDKK